MADNDLGEWNYFEIVLDDDRVFVNRRRDGQPAICLWQDFEGSTNMVKSNAATRDSCTPAEFLEYTRIFDFLAGMQRKSYDRDLRRMVPRQ